MGSAAPLHEIQIAPGVLDDQRAGWIAGLDRLWLADFDPTVSWIAAQPMWIVGRDGDAIRRHAPDLLLSRRGCAPLVVDVKPALFVARPKAKEVFAWTARICAARGLLYEVWTGDDVVRLSNIRMLAAGRRMRGRVSEELLHALARAARTGMTIDDIARRVRNEVDGQQIRLAILAMLWEGAWAVRMDTPLNGASIVTVVGADR